ncbi:MAG: type II toxin-antitoxin system PemK/MazF family toxin [Sphingomonadales bacterium]|jgi:mRNA interferase MazF|nr:type II toxin-antitoxin system PemK/MazF family toxin [Sphingomonadales bacterium]MCC6480284.1 type II toxin-antitoxin system PemK/MazF family toxin [Sphingomonadaceae bacterium]MBK6492699.1 type II toxin-antitoxin system PemK/MazF family toxin [Sphingomonadales bacterium]MBK6720429.1 type II toxin-antitoxin system PemK/MazF family toxin [Sphingomonadales bacterium]MBK8861828.1 type II toxin-antitoxin system PemK/MazF family toxin [Sphingomonadales bacterium]
MALQYYPKPGEILLCDYNTGFIEPEMTKRRPIVVISPRLRHRAGLVGVVPLSTTAPDPFEAHHCRIELATPLPQPFDSPVMWAKCDMVATVAHARLDRFKAGRKDGARVFLSGRLDMDQLKAVKAAVLNGLGLSSLTIHL